MDLLKTFLDERRAMHEAGVRDVKVVGPYVIQTGVPIPPPQPGDWLIDEEGIWEYQIDEVDGLILKRRSDLERLEDDDE